MWSRQGRGTQRHPRHREVVERRHCLSCIAGGHLKECLQDTCHKLASTFAFTECSFPPGPLRLQSTLRGVSCRSTHFPSTLRLLGANTFTRMFTVSASIELREWLVKHVRASRVFFVAESVSCWSKETPRKVARRAKRSAPRMGELSSALQALEGAELAPSTDDTLQMLSDHTRRPPRIREPLPREVANRSPEVPFELDEKIFLNNLRTAKRGAAAATVEPGSGSGHSAFSTCLLHSRRLRMHRTL